MKKYSLTLLAAFALALALPSCYKDLSTEAPLTRTLSIDTTGVNNTVYNGKACLEVANGSTLTLSPKLNLTGMAEADLSFTWEISIETTNSTLNLFSEFAQTRDLAKVVNWAPSNHPYLMVFTATDNQTGVKYMQDFQVIVVSGTGEGLIVADTQDGQSSDLTLVKSSVLMPGHKGQTQYKRNLFSLNNGKAFEGSIKQMIYTPDKTNNPEYLVYVLSDKDLQTINSSSYLVKQTFEDLFTMPPAKGGAFQTIGVDNMAQFFVYGEDLYVMKRTANETQFTSPVNYVSPNLTAKKKVANAFLNNAGAQPSFFDQTQGMLVTSIGFSQSYGLVYANPGTGPYAYDPLALQGYEAIGQVTSNGTEAFHVLRNTADKSISLFGYKPNASFTTSNAYTTAACPNIGKAQWFEGAGDRPVVYYATPETVYTGLLASGSMSATVGFNAPAGETITCIKLFADAWTLYFSNSSETPSSSHHNVLMVATYNGSEGKVYLLPISGNSGSLGSPTAGQTLTGFRKITALGFQGKQ